MQKTRQKWIEVVQKALYDYGREKGISDAEGFEELLLAETPPGSDLGDLAFPMFPFAKIFRCSPIQIAAELQQMLQQKIEAKNLGTAAAAGPYLNIKYNRPVYIEEAIRWVLESGDEYGHSDEKKGEKIVIEFSAPNTNKPLHLGHLRNDAIGMSISRILQALGAEVKNVNLINDRGIHICQSMLAYREFGNGETPESTGKKSDHFVGEYYVKYSSWSKQNPEVTEQAKKMLQQWEAGDPDVQQLWRRMNEWAIEGIKETYKRTNIQFDAIYFESQTYLEGKQEVLKGLEQDIFYRNADGSIWVDLSGIGLDKKVLLRADGTSLYLTQDLGTAIARHKDWPFDSMIYVVGSEQNYHFSVLFHVLDKLGYEWASQLHHLSYGMINLPEGKMKSREGTVVDADDILDRLHELAEGEIKSKNREAEVGDLHETCENIALAALHYYLLQVNPERDMVFNPSESISLNGNTGPYLQYMGARISSILRKYGRNPRDLSSALDGKKLVVDEEWDLIKLIADFGQRVKKAGDNLDPSEISSYLYELSKLFSKYYHDNPILHNDDEDLVTARILLTAAIRQVLINAFSLIGLPFLDVM